MTATRVRAAPERLYTKVALDGMLLGISRVLSLDYADQLGTTE